MLPLVIVGENIQRMEHIKRSMPMAECVPLRNIRFNTEQDIQSIPALATPSIVLLDVESDQSQDVSHYIQRFKRTYPSSAILVLVGFGDPNAEQKMIDSGADDVLLRPVSVMRLTLTLRNLSELVLYRTQSNGNDNASPLMSSHADTVHLLNADGTLKRLHNIEQDVITYAVEYCHGHISNTAKALGIGRSTLYRKLDAIQTRSKFEQRVLGRHHRPDMDSVY